MHRILGIVGSPRPGGNTEFLMDRLLADTDAIRAAEGLARRPARIGSEFD